jgi:hypothetical protein
MLIALIALLAAPASPTIAPLTAPFGHTSRGTVGVEFGFPFGGATAVGAEATTIGITYFLADNMAARADFGLNAFLSPSGTPALFNFGAGVRIYQLKRDSVAIFLQPSIVLARERFNPPDATVALAFAGGVGAEYFFADHFSVGGVLSLALNFRNIGGPAGSSVATHLTTNTSNLFASVYF